MVQSVQLFIHTKNQEEGNMNLETNLLSFSTHVDKKDLQAFAQALMTQVTNFQIENTQLKEQIKHLEELLKNSNVTIIK